MIQIRIFSYLELCWRHFRLVPCKEHLLQCCRGNVLHECQWETSACSWLIPFLFILMYSFLLYYVVFIGILVFDKEVEIYITYMYYTKGNKPVIRRLRRRENIFPTASRIPKIPVFEVYVFRPKLLKLVNQLIPEEQPHRVVR